MLCGVGTEKEQTDLATEWQIAMDVVLTEVKVKTSFWDCLPWYLCSIAQGNEQNARECAAEALRKFEGEPSEPTSHVSIFGRKHRMTSRFCCYDFDGDDAEDVPLRPSMDSPHSQHMNTVLPLHLSLSFVNRLLDYH